MRLLLFLFITGFAAISSYLWVMIPSAPALTEEELARGLQEEASPESLTFALNRITTEVEPTYTPPVREPASNPTPSAAMSENVQDAATAILTTVQDELTRLPAEDIRERSALLLKLKQAQLPDELLASVALRELTIPRDPRRITETDQFHTYLGLATTLYLEHTENENQAAAAIADAIAAQSVHEARLTITKQFLASRRDQLPLLQKQLEVWNIPVPTGSPTDEDGTRMH